MPLLYKMRKDGKRRIVSRHVVQETASKKVVVLSSLEWNEMSSLLWNDFGIMIPCSLHSLSDERGTRSKFILSVYYRASKNMDSRIGSGQEQWTERRGGKRGKDSSA